MRVIAGRLGGRAFDSPGTFKTHPMSDKMRGALFNILGDIEGLTVLDAFAGSGALSFEALSRGAASALLIEQDKAAQRVIAQNIRSLGLKGKAVLVHASTGAWLNTAEPGKQFDLVLCDPPYNDLQTNLVERLVSRVVPGGLLVLSWPAGTDVSELPTSEMVEHRTYGDAALAFYRKIG